MVTFQDVSDTVNVERALRERNEALEAADGIKIDFVHHVSYELRSPLTNIIGFAHFLGDPAFGPLTEKQREYLGYITVSTNALLALINNILDLATIDAGAMTLNLGDVDIRTTMDAAAEGIQDRLVKDTSRSTFGSGGIGSFSRTSGACGKFSSTCSPMRSAFRRPAKRALIAERHADAVVFSGHRPGTRHPARGQGQSFRSVRDRFHGLAASRPRLGLSLVAPLSNCMAAR